MPRARLGRKECEVWISQFRKRDFDFHRGMYIKFRNKDRILKVVSAHLPPACSRRPDIRDRRNCENAELRRAAASPIVSASISISVPVQLPLAHLTTNNDCSPTSTSSRGSGRYFSNLCVQLQWPPNISIFHADAQPPAQ